jgi:hypothetical protein
MGYFRGYGALESVWGPLGCMGTEFISVFVDYNLYSSSNIVRVIKLRRMRWAGHVAHMG